MLVEGFDSVFKGSELDHGVGHLSHPKWGKTLVESIHSLLGFNLVESLHETSSESASVSCLHSYFELLKDEFINI